MYLSIYLWHIAILGLSSLTSEARRRWNAINDHDHKHITNLYLREWNEDRPHELDPANTDASVRLRICKNITRSTLFKSYGMRPVDMKSVYDELNQAKYSNIFQRIYPTTELQHPQDRYAYDNSYVRQKFEMMIIQARGYSVIHKEEYAFMCLLREGKHPEHLLASDEDVYSVEKDSEDDFMEEESTARENEENEDLITNSDQRNKGEVEEKHGSTSRRYDIEANVGGEIEGGNEKYPIDEQIEDIIPIYVSKAYGVPNGLHVHRFLFLDKKKFDEEDFMHVEQSAEVCVRPDFNVELHYLELRKHRQPASSVEYDPISRYNTETSTNEGHLRICRVVAASSYFQERLGSVIRILQHARSFQEDISFKTDEGIREANGKSYRELLFLCSAIFSDREVRWFYISRAYNPFQVLLYLRDSSNSKFYLEALVTHVSMVQDNYNFGSVEI